MRSAEGEHAADGDGSRYDERICNWILRLMGLPSTSEIKRQTGMALGEGFEPDAPQSAVEPVKKPAQSSPIEGKASGIKAAQMLVHAARDAIAEKNKGNIKPRPGSRSTNKPKSKKRKGKTARLSRAFGSTDSES